MWILGFQLIGYSISLISASNINSWYIYLNKSPLTPANYIFGIVWTFLYILLAIVAWKLHSFKQSYAVRIVFWCQMVCNWLWSPVFFYFHYTGVALILILLMIAQTITLLFLLRKSCFWQQLSLSVYLLWISFAAYLNTFIWMYN